MAHARQTVTGPIDQLDQLKMIQMRKTYREMKQSGSLPMLPRSISKQVSIYGEDKGTDPVEHLEQRRDHIFGEVNEVVSL